MEKNTLNKREHAKNLLPPTGPEPTSPRLPGDRAGKRGDPAGLRGNGANLRGCGVIVWGSVVIVGGSPLDTKAGGNLPLGQSLPTAPLCW